MTVYKIFFFILSSFVYYLLHFLGLCFLRYLWVFNYHSKVVKKIDLVPTLHKYRINLPDERTLKFCFVWFFLLSDLNSFSDENIFEEAKILPMKAFLKYIMTRRKILSIWFLKTKTAFQYALFFWVISALLWVAFLDVLFYVHTLNHEPHEWIRNIQHLMHNLLNGEHQGSKLLENIGKFYMYSIWLSWLVNYTYE